MVNEKGNIALLIDADNAKSELIVNFLTEAGKHGKVTIRRIYGNWTDNRLSSWKTQINLHSIRPIQKFSLAKGKNSTDTAMIIDAMDILHSKAVNGFCIVSSDSDYTGLAQRIREQGLFVMGIGEAEKTAKAFVNACDLFVFAENLTDNEKEKIVKNSNKKSDGSIKNLEIEFTDNDLPINKITQKPLDIKNIIEAFNMVQDDNEYAYMGEVGQALRKLDPSFDSRTYGSATLTNLFKRLPNLFELIYKDSGSSLYIKLKDNK
jgi:uncharacterized LabA/DUF88 family protein